MAAAKSKSNAPYARRKRGFEATSALLKRQMRGPLEKRGFSESRLITHWPEVVGPEIAAMARPVRIRHRRSGLGATLVLLTTGAQAPLLSMQRERVRELVNACYGYNAVREVQITQTAPTGFAEGQVAFETRPKDKPAAPPDPALVAKARQAADPITDPGLKQALERLARNVLSKQRP